MLIANVLITNHLCFGTLHASLRHFCVGKKLRTQRSRLDVVGTRRSRCVADWMMQCSKGTSVNTGTNSVSGQLRNQQSFSIHSTPNRQSLAHSEQSFSIQSAFSQHSISSHSACNQQPFSIQSAECCRVRQTTTEYQWIVSVSGHS